MFYYNTFPENVNPPSAYFFHISGKQIENIMLFGLDKIFFYVMFV